MERFEQIRFFYGSHHEATLFVKVNTEKRIVAKMASSQVGDVWLDASLHSFISISVALISTAAFINMNFHC